MFFSYPSKRSLSTKKFQSKNPIKVFINSEFRCSASIDMKPLTKRAGTGSNAESLIQCTNPRIRIRLKMSRIRNTVKKIKFEINNHFKYQIRITDPVSSKCLVVSDPSKRASPTEKFQSTKPHKNFH